MSDVDLAELRRWVGREQVVDDWLGAQPARALGGLLNLDHPPGEGEALPLAWQWLYFLDAPRSDAIGADGHPRRGGFLPPVPLPRRMWAAGSLTAHAPLQIGSRARKRSTVRSIDLKAGQSGPLVFVEVEHRYEQEGRLCLEETQSLVYREAPAAPTAPAPGEPVAAGDATLTLVPDAALLFRYSALTYNGHRIHYDRDYASGVEFYPGLVVHGPLTATLLLHLLAREQPGRSVGRFAFRARRPAFDGRPLTLNLSLNPNANANPNPTVGAEEVQLWSRDPDGFLGMQATATLR